MRYYRPLNYILGNSIKIDIIRFLVKTSAEWSGREIAKELKTSPAACHKALKSLYREGILLLRTTGNTYLYRLNPNHLIVKKQLQPLFRWELRSVKNLADLITAKIKKFSPRYFVSVALFGSIIRHQEKPDSDIDLLVLIKTPGNKPKVEWLMNKLGNFLSSNTGNRLAPYILSVTEFRQKYKKRLPVVKNIAKSHYLVSGKPLETWLAK